MLDMKKLTDSGNALIQEKYQIMFYGRCLSIIFILAICLVNLHCMGKFSVAGENTALTPMELSQKYEKSLSQYKRMKGIWTNCRHNWEAGKELPWSGLIEKWTVYRDHDRAKTLQTQSGGKQKLLVDYEVINIEGKTWLGVFPSDKDIIVIGKQKANTEDYYGRLGLPTCSASFGIIAQIWIPTFLRTSNLSSRKDTLDGKTIYILEGVANNVKITLWLDTTREYAVQKIFFDGLRSPRPVSYEYSVQSYEEISGVSVPSEATLIQFLPPAPIISPLEQGQLANVKNNKVTMSSEYKNINEIKLISIDFDPKFTDDDFRITQSIPNGTEVNMQDAPQLNYVWQDGKAIPQLNKKALAAARGARFVGLAKTSWIWMISGALVLLIAVFIFRIYRRNMLNRNH
jgi:hypothetical protein